jgi:hypothetical protein
VLAIDSGWSCTDGTGLQNGEVFARNILCLQNRIYIKHKWLGLSWLAELSGIEKANDSLGPGQFFDQAFMLWKKPAEMGAAGEFKVSEIETRGYGASHQRE